MAKLVYGLNQSLDGYVDHDKFAPDAQLFQHFIEQVRTSSGALYGRKLYEIMRYWDADQADWTQAECDYAGAWRAHPKWVISRTLKSVGPNAQLVEGDLGDSVQKLKAERAGEIQVGGAQLAQSLGALELIDEYWLYVHPVVLGAGTPFFAGARPRLRLLGSERIGADVIRLRYGAA